MFALRCPPGQSPALLCVLGPDCSWVHFPGSPVGGCPAGLGHGRCWRETGVGRREKLESIRPAIPGMLGQQLHLFFSQFSRQGHHSQFLQVKLASEFQ